MEQPRKLFIFFALSLGFMILWSRFVMPNFLPPPPKKKPVDEIAANEDPGKDQGGDAEEKTNGEQTEGDDPANSQAQARNNDAPPAETDLVEAEQKQITIGSQDPAKGYFLEVTLDSRGASIDAIRFSDPQFLELDRQSQLQIVGDTATEHRTFSTAVDGIEAKLAKSLKDWNWELVDEETQQANGVNSSVVFRVEAGGLEIRKRYSIAEASTDGTKKTAINGYLIDCELTFTNKGADELGFTYELQGPVGLRIENEQHARENRKLQVAFEGDEDADDDAIMAGKLHGMFEDEEVETWKARFRYVGVDNTYFAAIIVADPAEQTIGEIEPMLIDPNDKKPDHSDISLRLTSLPQSLQGLSLIHI